MPSTAKGFRYFSKAYYNEDGTLKSQEEIDSLRAKIIIDFDQSSIKKFKEVIKKKKIIKRKQRKYHVIELFDRDRSIKVGITDRLRHRNNVKAEVFNSKYNSSLDGENYYRYEPKCNNCDETNINELGVNVENHKINSVGSYKYLISHGFPTRDVICRKCVIKIGRKFSK